jgi:hypothetical protein
MGANAQTSVTLFVANAVLTAAQQNFSAATGVPVFATTVTRDAAFGGSNKVLAEGQLCYLEASDVVQYYTGAAWATVGPTTSKVVQIVNATTSTSTTNTTATYADTTLTGSITPTSASNKVLVIVNQNGCGKGRDTSTSNVNLWWQGQLLRGASAITSFEQGGGYNNAATTNFFGGTSLTYLDSPATTSATTYKTQFRLNTGVGDGAGVQFQSAVSFITLMEVTP